MKAKELKLQDVVAPDTLGGAWSWSCKPGSLVEGLHFLKPVCTKFTCVICLAKYLTCIPTVLALLEKLVVHKNHY